MTLKPAAIEVTSARTSIKQKLILIKVADVCLLSGRNLNTTRE